MKKWGWALGIIILLLTIAGFFIAHSAKKRIKAELHKIHVQYDDMDIRLIPAKISLKGVKYNIDQNKAHTENISISNISYWDYLIHKDINIDEIKISSPTWKQIYSEEEVDSTQSKNTSSNIPFQNLSVHSLIIDDANILFIKNQDTILNISELQINFEEIITDNHLINKKIPLTWENYSISFEHLYSHISNIQSIDIGNFSCNKRNFSLKDFQILPRYSRDQYIHHIPYEKDLATLEIPEIKGDDLIIESLKDTVIFKLNRLNVLSPHLNLYRDKTVKDDPTVKDLYSKMLRTASVYIQIDSTQINDGYVSYEEKHKKEREPGKVTFAQLNANIGKLYNYSSSGKIPETKINMSALTFDESKVNVDWTFNIDNPYDVFTINGAGYNFKSSSINNFLTPAFLIETDGVVDQFFFNYFGDNSTATGDFQIFYNEFDVKVLNKKKKEIDIISWIGKLFVKNKPEDNGNTKAHIEKVERDNTKSFWNYFWTCIKEGLIETLTIKS